MRPVECVAQSLYISAPELSQIAALAALSATDELEHYKSACQANRDFLMARLPELGLPLLSPTAQASSALELSLDYARTRVQFGKPIGDFQMIRAKLAELLPVAKAQLMTEL